MFVIKKDFARSWTAYIPDKEIRILSRTKTKVMNILNICIIGFMHGI